MRGYKRTVMCEGVRDEIACNLGEGRDTCTQLLNGVLQRRLMPTPWLNWVGSVNQASVAHHCNTLTLLQYSDTRFVGFAAPRTQLSQCLNWNASFQNFREPLYLKDKPVRVEDTRSEEERRYPELFRRKLEGASAAVLLWRQHVLVV